MYKKKSEEIMPKSETFFEYFSIYKLNLYFNKNAQTTNWSNHIIQQYKL
jgi:hypothetical protein